MENNNNRILVDVMVRMPFDEMQDRLSPEQITAVLNGLGEVIAADVEAHRKGGE